MKKLLAILALVALCSSLFAQGIPAPATPRLMVDANGTLLSATNPLPITGTVTAAATTLPGYVTLAPGSTTVTIGPHAVTQIRVPAGTYGIWANSFNGVTLFGAPQNLSTATFYVGVPVASGSGLVVFESLTGTTTPNIGAIANGGASTTVTFQVW